MSIVSVESKIAREKFLKAPFALKHGLSDNPLFSLERLVELAQSMPRDRIEYNSGKLMPGQNPGTIAGIDMPPADVIRRIEEANAWMAIKNVEHEPQYFAVLKDFVDAAQAAAGKRRGDYSDLQGFIFVSSANATTPFHVDAEENILIQIRGDKFVHIFDNRDCALISEEAMEISPSKHRNQHYEPAFREACRSLRDAGRRCGASALYVAALGEDRRALFDLDGDDLEDAAGQPAQQDQADERHLATLWISAKTARRLAGGRRCEGHRA